MFNVGDILINKANNSLVVLILTQEGRARILQSNSQERIGTVMTCSNPKFYILATDIQKQLYLKEKIKSTYKKEKNTKIPNYL